MLLGELDKAGFAVSSGSSCTSSTLTPSHVLAAMGVLTEGNVRVSLPYGTAEEDVERFLAALPGLVAAVRAPLGLDLRLPAAEPEPEPVVRTADPSADPSAEPEPAGEAEALVLDALGKRCPLPVIDLARRIGEVPPGGTVVVLADDEAARLDIPAWCDMRAQEYLGEAPAARYGADRGTAYLVRRTD
ncbi:sulfurtransferase TusA family protein [Kitasatospora arboriphila]